jgi:hypothetical protein
VTGLLASRGRSGPDYQTGSARGGDPPADYGMIRSAGCRSFNNQTGGRMRRSAQRSITHYQSNQKTLQRFKNAIF